MFNKVSKLYNQHQGNFDIHRNNVLALFFSRFIINIPEEEREDLIRIFFQIELAHWFYLDFYCTENPDLRSCGIKDFSSQNILFVGHDDNPLVK